MNKIKFLLFPLFFSVKLFCVQDIELNENLSVSSGVANIDGDYSVNIDSGFTDSSLESSSVNNSNIIDFNVNAVACKSAKIAPNKERIAVKRAKIESDSSFGRKMDYLAGTAVAVAACAVAYQIGKYFCKKANIVKTKSLSNYELTKKIEEIEKKIDGVNEPSFFSKAGLKKAANLISNNLVTSGVLSFCTGTITYFYKKYHSFGTLKDFIQNKLTNTNVENRVELIFPESGLKEDDGQETREYMNAVLSEVKNKMLFNSVIFDSLNYFALCHDRLKEDKNVAINVVEKEFSVALKNVVDFTESVIAFMQYKVDSINNAMLSEDDAMLPEYLFATADDYCKRVQLVLDGQSSESLVMLSQEFKEISIGLIDAFNGFESRLAWLGK